MTLKWFLLVRVLLAILCGASLAAGQSEFVVHSFAANASQGSQPAGNLIADSAGNLYGTTSQGGPENQGTVYELVTPVPPKTAWSEIVLHGFGGGADGALPLAGVTSDSASNLYGVTSQGGAFNFGTVFELVPPSSPGGQWTESVLYSFQGGANDGRGPESAVIFRDGSLYGTTGSGGSFEFNCAQGCGTIFQLDPPATAGAAWTETVIHFFKFGQGGGGSSTPVFDGLGDLYGTTESGGLKSQGVAYRLTAPVTQGGPWTYKVLYAFLGYNSDVNPPLTDTAHPIGGVTLRNGRLYGVGLRGGASDYGAVFELVPPPLAGGKWTENILYSFHNGTDRNPGGYPAANVIFDSSGNLYSTTSYTFGTCPDVDSDCGTVFRLNAPNWTATVLHDFTAPGGKDGSEGYPNRNGVVFGKNGGLFGATQMGGTGNEGVVFGVVK